LSPLSISLVPGILGDSAFSILNTAPERYSLCSKRRKEKRKYCSERSRLSEVESKIGHIRAVLKVVMQKVGTSTNGCGCISEANGINRVVLVVQLVRASALQNMRQPINTLRNVSCGGGVGLGGDRSRADKHAFWRSQ
jgi:hypothetical protein